MSRAVEKALERLNCVIPAGKDGMYYQGQDLGNVTCKEIAVSRALIRYTSYMLFYVNHGKQRQHINHVRMNG